MIVKTLAFSMAAFVLAASQAAAQTPMPDPAPAPTAPVAPAAPTADAPPPTKVDATPDKPAKPEGKVCRSIPRLDSPMMRKVVCN